VQRILRPGGWAALIWNERDLNRHSRCLAGYEALLLDYGNDYRAIRYRHQGTDSIPVYSAARQPAVAEFPTSGDELAAVAALVRFRRPTSRPRDSPRHAEFMQALKALVDDGQAVNATIDMPLQTCRVHAARLT